MWNALSIFVVIIVVTENIHSYLYIYVHCIDILDYTSKK